MDKNNIEWRVKEFEYLTVTELYDVLHLRCKVFVVEQNAAYIDVDNKDQKAIHISGYVDDKLIVYCRLFRQGDYMDEASIGRVVVAEEYRSSGYGHQLMDKAIELVKSVFDEKNITISAQLYLQQFYEGHGFSKTSDVYLEDDIPHIQMKKQTILK